MINGKSFLAVIPARGGSKEIPKKNMVELGGVPLISHTFNQVRLVESIDHICVSTDDPNILHYSLSQNIPVITRPSHLAMDTSKTEEALIHSLLVLEEAGKYFDYVIVLEPTSPFRTISTIKRCMHIIIDSRSNSLLTVKSTTNNIGEVINGLFVPIKKGQPRRRQDRRPYYIETSTVYVCSVSYLKEHGTLVSDQWSTVIVEHPESVDINTHKDLDYARYLMGNTK